MTNREDEFHTTLSTFLHSKPSEPAKSISSLKCPMFALEGPLVWDASDLIRNTRWMTGGLLPLETLTFVLSVQTLRINHVCEAELEKVYGHEREQQQTRRHSW